MESSTLTSHVRTHKYYFDQNFKLGRHDYAPDVLASAPAAHYPYDHISMGGLSFPTLRRVVVIDTASGLPMHFGPIPTLVSLTFHSFEIKRAGAADVSKENKWFWAEAPRP
ncbi:hypothetical protein TrVFT333_004720 [Trichoderma virens FT-333]|nr:hypothetical protein TrVFT333_004720 [Trichoderma virens FT-333]